MILPDSRPTSPSKLSSVADQNEGSVRGDQLAPAQPRDRAVSDVPPPPAYTRDEPATPIIDERTSLLQESGLRSDKGHRSWQRRLSLYTTLFVVSVIVVALVLWSVFHRRPPTGRDSPPISPTPNPPSTSAPPTSSLPSKPPLPRFPIIDCNPDWKDASLPDIRQSLLTLPSPKFGKSYSENISRAVFDLNVTSPSLHIQSKDTSGLISLVAFNGDNENISVEVVHAGPGEHRLCRVDEANGKQTIDVSLGNTRGNSDDLFIITVRFPARTIESNLLKIKSFSTEMPYYEHHGLLLAGAVEFGFLHLKTVVGKIQFASVNVIRGLIESTYGKITGEFFSRDSLTLSGVNAEIDIYAILWSTFVEGRHQTSQLDLKTQYSPIHANVGFMVTSDPDTSDPQLSQGGRFEVLAETSSAPLSIEFTSSPLNSFLQFTGVTSNGRMEVSLHKTFESTIHTETGNQSGSGTRIVLHDNADPAGEGRKRIAQWDKARGDGMTDGRVSWGPWRNESRTYGSATLSAENAFVSLNV